MLEIVDEEMHSWVSEVLDDTESRHDIQVRMGNLPERLVEAYTRSDEAEAVPEWAVNFMACFAEAFAAYQKRCEQPSHP